MRILDKIKHAALPALAAVLVLGAAAGNSSSYFTTYVTAQGGHTLTLKDVYVEPDEEMDNNTKNISVRNTGEVPCYVRVKVIQASTNAPIEYSGEGWSQYGEYWYYDGIVEPDNSTGTLSATIKLPTSGTEKPIPEGTTFNVTVITECAKILYDESGNAKPNGPDYKGWSLKEG